MQIDIDYTPTEKQCLFHSSVADEVLYGGAAGGGKSKAIVMEALIDALEHPGVHSYLFRKTYPELRDTLVKEAQKSIPPELGSYSASTHDYKLINGSVLHFRYCRTIQDAYIYQGAEMHRLFIDELTHFTQDIYDYLKTRVRVPKDLGVKPFIRCATNPGGAGHGWVKQRFIDGKQPFKTNTIIVHSDVLGKDEKVTVQYIPAYATDNPHLTDDYIIQLEQKPEALKKALLLGDWDIFEGQVFTEWRNKPEGYMTGKHTHVIEPFKIPLNWRIYRGFDYGYTKPFSVGWYAVDEDRRIYRIREYYGCVKGKANVGIQIDPYEIAKGIKQIEANDPNLMGRKIIGIADPAIQQQTTGESVADMMAHDGVYWNYGDHTRIAGKMQFHYRLKFDKNGVPMFYCFKTCPEFIRTIPTIVYSSKNVEDIDTECEDHIYDECRYVFMANPINAPELPPPPSLPQDDPFEWRTTNKKNFYAL